MRRVRFQRESLPTIEREGGSRHGRACRQGERAEENDPGGRGVTEKAREILLNDLATAARGMAQAELPIDPKEQPGVEGIDALAAGQKVDQVAIFDLRSQTRDPRSRKIAEGDTTVGEPFDDGEGPGLFLDLREGDQLLEEPQRPIGAMPIGHVVMARTEIDPAILIAKGTQGIDKLVRLGGETESENGFKKGDTIEPICTGDQFLRLIDRAAER